MSAPLTTHHSPLTIAEADFTSCAKLASPAQFAVHASQGAWLPAKHLLFLNRHLLNLAARKTTHLLVTAPPRHGKSFLISKYFPAWYLLVNPNENVILATYGTEFAANWGQQVRDLVRDNWRPFGEHSKPMKWARKGFALSLYGGGNLLTAGVGGPITGIGGNCIVCDDLLKNSEEADSEIYRNKLDDWFRSTLYSRREPDAVMVMLMTRWHVDDVVGRRIEESAAGGTKWTIVNLPDIAEEDEPPYPEGMGRKVGEALWPERYNVEELKKIEIAIGPRHYAALYKGRPVPQGGQLFQRDWFEVMVSCPAMLRAVRYWDLAATEKSGSNNPDWTAGVLMGVDAMKRYWVLDVARFRGDPGTVEHYLKIVTRNDARNPIVEVRTPIKTYIEQEPGAGSKISVQNLIRLLAGYPVYAHRAGSMESSGSGLHNKAARADPLAGQAKIKNVKLLAGDWNRDFLLEVTSFPSGKFDDQVDACSGAFVKLRFGRGAATAVAGERQGVVVQRERPDRLREPWEIP